MSGEEAIRLCVSGFRGWASWCLERVLCVVAFRSCVYDCANAFGFHTVRRRWVRERFRSRGGSVGVFVSTKNKVCDWLWRVKRGVDEMLRNSIGFVCPAKTTRLCVWLSWAGVLVFGKCCVVEKVRTIYILK